ncbi:MAG: carboxymuconolactone decarboxylase family protein [Phycisphaerales bacterium]
MPRIAPVDQAAAGGRVKEIFDGPLKGKTHNMFRSMGVSAAALDIYLSLVSHLRRGALSVKEMEIIQLAVGELNGCDYCMAAHTPGAQKAGLTLDQVMAARRGDAGRMGDAKFAALLTFVLALHEKRGHVSDADVESLRSAGYSDAALAEIIGCYALAVYTNYFNHVNQTELDFPPAPAV